MPTDRSATSLRLPPLADRRIDWLLARRVEETPDKVFLSFPAEKRTQTYAEMATAGTRHAGFFHAAGIKPGDHIGLMLSNGSAWTNAWFGAIGLGAVDVGIHHDLGGMLLEHQLRVAKVKAVICDAAAFERVLAVSENASGLVLELAFLAGAEDVAVAARAEQQGITLRYLHDAARAAPIAAASWAPQELMSIRFTSGTTGPAKAASLTMSQVAVWANYLVQLLQFSAQDRIYAPFPLHHHLASVMGVIGALTAGGACIVDRQLSVSRFWSTAVAERATLGLILDPVVKMLLGRPATPEDHVYTIRRFYISRPNKDFERRFGAKLQTAYALTEGSVLSYVPPGEQVEAPNCVGYPNPHFDIRVVDEDDEEVAAAGKQGEIVFRPLHPGLCMGSYFDNPAATVNALRNFWFHTGDLGSFDTDGRLCFFERMGDTIRRKGVNIPSFHIEEVAMAYPGVKEVAAVGIPSEIGEFEIKLCVTEAGGSKVSPEGIIRWMASQLPRDMVPRYLEIRDDFDRTITQKILKRALKEEGMTSRTVVTDAWLEP